MCARWGVVPSAPVGIRTRGQRFRDARPLPCRSLVGRRGLEPHPPSRYDPRTGGGGVHASPFFPVLQTLRVATRQALAGRATTAHSLECFRPAAYTGGPDS